MARRTSRPDGAVLALAARLQSAPDLDAFVDVLLDGLLELVPGELAGWNEIDLLSGQVTGRGRPEEVARALYPLVTRHIGHHPLIAHYQRSGSTAAARISDVCRPDEWRRNPLYMDAFRPLGLRYQIGVPLLATRATLSAAAVSRGVQDFTRSDVDTLTALAPLAANAERGLRWRLSLESELAALTPNQARALVAKDGTVIAADERAFAPVPVSGVGAGDRFVLVHVRNDREHRPPLTDRQLEVIRAVSDGSTVAAAARRLGLSPRTVDKHLQHAYARLGVSGRLAAIARLRDEGWLTGAG